MVYDYSINLSSFGRHNHNPETLMKFTAANASVFFQGRPGDPRLGEVFKPVSPSDLTKAGSQTFIITGAPDDTGVIANRGRAGAKGGPDGIRAALYKFAVPGHPGFAKAAFIDGGNVVVSDQITTTHERAFELSKLAAATGATLITFGGGHDFAAPHILGGFAGLPATSKGKQTYGVINIDPHLDVRELENGKPHSGTPFRQIAESGKVNPAHIVQFGARVGRNAASHFDYCRHKKIKVHEFGAIKSKGDVARQFKSTLTALTRSCTQVAVTIDMDCCSDVEGVSAAPVIGFTAWELCQIAAIAGASPRVRILDLAEVAPDLDPSGRTCRIAAEIVFHFIMGRLSAKTRSK